MKTPLLITISAFAFFIACNQAEEKKESESTAMPVEISDELNLNEQVARDISTLDFTSLVSSKLNITDKTILDAISIVSSKDSISGKVSLNLQVDKNAEMYKSAIEKLYKDFAGKKIAE